MGTNPCFSNTPRKVSNIHCRRAMAVGPKSRVPLGMEGLLIEDKITEAAQFQPAAVLNEQGDNQDRGEIQMTCMVATYKPISRHGSNGGNSSLAWTPRGGVRPHLGR